MTMIRLALTAVLVLAAAAQGAAADALIVEGLMFSDEEGGFTLISASGRGTPEDPFVIVEEITEMRPAALIIRGLTAEWGNRLPTNHPSGFVIRKVIINHTDLAWDSYDHELQIERGVPSDIYDGLSFGQGSEVGRPFRSDQFARNTTHDEPRDFINYHDGLVNPGESVTFEFVITATSALAQFYIVQDPNRPIAALDRPRRVRRV